MLQWQIAPLRSSTHTTTPSLSVRKRSFPSFWQQFLKELFVLGRYGGPAVLFTDPLSCAPSVLVALRFRHRKRISNSGHQAGLILERESSVAAHLHVLLHAAVNHQ